MRVDVCRRLKSLEMVFSATFCGEKDCKIIHIELTVL